MKTDGVIEIKKRDLASMTKELADVMQRIKHKNIAVMREYIELGRLWKLVRDGKLWMAQAGVNSFREFCEKESGFSHSWVYGAIRVSESFGGLIESDPALVEMDHSRLVKLLPVAEDSSEEVRLEWLHKAARNSKKDFDNNLREAKGKQPSDTCSHPAEWRSSWEHCDLCTHWILIKKSVKTVKEAA